METVVVAPYMTRIKHGPATYVRVLMNDVPMYDRAVMDFASQAFPATPWLIPGQNRVEVEVRDAPKNPHCEQAPPHFELFLFHQDMDALNDGSNETPLYHEEYPAVLETLPPEERKLPCSWTATFKPEGYIPEPIWADSAPGPVPEQGTPELLKAVFDLHIAFEKKDVDALVAVAALKLQDQQRYFGPLETNIPSEVKKEHVEMLAQPWDLMPFEPAKLRFRSCQGGRVAYVTHEDGGPPLRAKHQFDPLQRWAAKPLLMRQGSDDWRIYR